MARKKLDLVLENVEIEAVAAEGKALAHLEDGRIVFVEFAVPGDIVDIRVTKKKKNYMEGTIVKLVKPSDRRLEAFCEHFGVCGGCKWQSLPYDMQLEAKTKQVNDQLSRIGHLSFSEVRPALASDNTKYYRNKLEYSFSTKRWILRDEDEQNIPDNEKQGLGFHVGRFFDKVLDIKKCYLQKEPSNAIRLFIKNYALEHNLDFFDIRENKGYLRNLFIRSNEAGDFMIILCFFYDDKDSRNPLLDSLLEAFPQITSLYYVINTKLNDSISDQECILYKGDEVLLESMENLSFRIGPKSFYQTNSQQAYKLYSVTRDFAELRGDEVVYDLYTGTGTIAQFVASKAKKVIGIEYVPEAIEDAKVNAKNNNIDNCSFFAGDMKDILTDDFVKEQGKPDLIILDPPRAGIHPDVANVILNAEAEKIVYVSCNPASQARDLAIICRDYKIDKIQPVDMFPHTHHVENVVRLTRKSQEEIQEVLQNNS